MCSTIPPSDGSVSHAVSATAALGTRQRFGYLRVRVNPLTPTLTLNRVSPNPNPLWLSLPSLAPPSRRQYHRPRLNRLGLRVNPNPLNPDLTTWYPSTPQDMRYLYIIRFTLLRHVDDTPIRWLGVTCRLRNHGPVDKKAFVRGLCL